MSRKKLVVNRRESIIHSADKLFSHYGFEKTTMEDISRESGIPRATIYLEFSGGKEDILMASVERYLNQTLNEMRELARKSVSSRLEALKKAIIYYILRAHERAHQQYYDYNNAERHIKRARTEMPDFFQARQDFFAELLQQAALGGEVIEPMHFDQVAQLILQGMIAFLPPLCSQLSSEEVEKTTGTFFSIFLSGLAHSNKRATLN